MSFALGMLRALGGKAVAALAVVGTILLALVGIKRAARREGRDEARAEARNTQLKEALDEQQETHQRLDRMRDARSDGPHSRDDVVERLRDGSA